MGGWFFFGCLASTILLAMQGYTILPLVFAFLTGCCFMQMTSGDGST